MSHLRFTTIFYGLLIINTVISLPAISPHHQRAHNLQSLTQPRDINHFQQKNVEDNSYQATQDVISTIEQVQKILEQDPKLPRLTRGEIEDLFEQVTREEYEKSLELGDVTKARHMRALMLVLPFNTDKNSSDDLQEIYSRPPITKVVQSGEVKPQKEQEVIVPSGKVEIISIDHQIPTTYKPVYRKKVVKKQPKPTTYRPNPDVMKTATTSGLSTNIRVTSTTTATPPFREAIQTTVKYSSQYSAKRADFNKESTQFSKRQSDTRQKTTSKPKITPELEEILESLGFAAQSQSKKRFKLGDPSVEEYTRPVISSLIKQDPLEVEEFKPLPVSFTAEDFKKSLAPQIRADDFIEFKPLNIQNENLEEIKPELEQYLKMFGIVNERSSRSRKLPLEQYSTTTNPLLESERRIKRIDTDFEDNFTANIRLQKSDAHDYHQLKELLNNIRQLQELNVSLTKDNLTKLDLNNYNLSESLMSQGPNPIDNSEYDSNDPKKNEVKRQSDSSEPTRFNLGLNVDIGNESLPAGVERTSSSASEDSSTTTTTTTESSKDIDLDSDDGPDPVTEQPLPPPRKNGFYFLADFNSFLEVGDGAEKVEVRFNPRIGDPSRFIPVNVP